MASVAKQFASSDNRFRVVRRLGEGGMGVVYEVDDLRRSQRVALKTLRHDGSDLYSFKREFRTLADLSHPNLIQLYDLVVDGGEAFFTMELVQGCDLFAYCRHGESQESSDDRATLPQHCAVGYDEARVRSSMLQLTRGLSAIHDARKLHRDIKPSNVIVTAEGRVVLLDFGLAKDLEHRQHETLNGHIVGTPHYMSPEQAGAELALEPASDWYSVGVLLYELLTGQLPFVGPPLKVLVDKQQKQPPRPRDLVPYVPRDLDELCVALLSRDAGARPDAEAVLRALGDRVEPASRPPSSHRSSRSIALTGRDAELAQLQLAYDRLLDGGASAVVVRSASGMGKSTLVKHFLQQLRERGEAFTLLEGRCYEREDIPYKAIDSLIDGFSQYWRQLPRDRAAELLPRDASYLPRLFPVLGRVPAVADAPRLPEIPDPQELQRRGFGALRELLQRLADRSRVVLFLDDMQWVDADTVRLLADVLRPPDAPAVMLIVAARSQKAGLLDTLLERLDVAIERIEIGPLAPADALRVAELMLPDADAMMVRRVAVESEGSPFFLGELARYLQSVVDVDLDDVRLDNVLGKRIATLAPAAREMLELICLAGEPISRQAVAAAAGLSFDELTREARALRAASFVRSAGGRASDHVSPYHNRIREVVVAELPPARRASLHRRLALALVEHGATDHLLAHHWGAANEPARAAHHAELAGRAAALRLDFDRAAELFRVALDHGSHRGESRRQLQVALADALSHAGRPADAARAYAAAVELSDCNQRLDMRRRAAEELLRGGYFDEGLEAIRAVLGEIDHKLSRTPRHALRSLLARRAWLAVRGTRYRERDASAITPDALTKVDIFWSAASGLAMVHHLRGHEYQSRHLLAALRIGEPSRLARAFALEAAYQAGQANRKAAMALFDKANDLAERSAEPYAQSLVCAIKGLIAFYVDSDWNEAFARLDEAETMVRTRLGSSGWESDTMQYYLCLTLYYRGELRELTRRVPAYLREAERRGDRFAEVGLRATFNFVSLIRDDAAAAQRDIEFAEAAWGSSDGAYVSQHIQMLLARCQLAMYRGRPAEALAYMEAAQQPLRRSLLLRAPWVACSVEHLHGRVALATAASLPEGDERRAELLELVGRLVRRTRRSPLRLGAAYGHLMAAVRAKLLGDRATSELELRAAIDKLEELDTRLLAQVARRRLGELVGGDEGAELVRRADAWLRAEGIVKPKRWARMLLPWG